MKKNTEKFTTPSTKPFTEKEETFQDWCLIQGRKGKDWDEFECLWNAGYFKKHPITAEDIRAFIEAR